ncbi:hypothetical protein L5D93_26390 [Paenibacillus thiaminolyticus]|nr:hypothetical protein [Paenibacillus thiaminolyticus]
MKRTGYRSIWLACGNQIRLSIVRGSVAVVRHHGTNERTSRYCRRSMETMEHFDRVIDRCLGL